MSERGTPLPGTARAAAGLPSTPEVIVVNQFAGINQRVARAAVRDQEYWWSVNLMPIAPNELRSLYDSGPAVYTAPTSLRIVHHGWYILDDDVSRGLVFLSDGSAQQFSVSGTVQIAPATTFNTTGNTLPAFCQYGVQFVAIVTDATNGFFLYDNTNLYMAGTISPEFTLTDGGMNYTSAPAVTVNTNGSGTGAAFSATVSGGAVSYLTATAAGSGYKENDLVWLTFSGGGSGTSPTATATLANGVITSVQLVSGGSGYTTSSTVSISDATGSGADIQISGLSGGVITALSVAAGGSDYSDPSLSISVGSGAEATALMSNGVVTSVTVNTPGSGLTGTISASMLDPNGAGAELSVGTNSGAVTVVNVLQGGSGYQSGVVVFEGGGVASATVALMPFGVNGTDVETYQSSLWVTGGVKAGKPASVFFTAPETASDFGPPGGAFPSTDSFLKHQWSAVVQDSGFLYLVGDSSCNYISGVQTSGEPAITTFSNLNIDPTIGTIWPNSVTVFGTTPMFANVYGVHAIIGGSVRKVSEALDLLFFEATPQGNVIPSSALATVFGRHVYCFLYRALSPITGDAHNYIFCWDGTRWWPYLPSQNMIEISTQELNSNIVAFGTDGTSIYLLFEYASSTLEKRLYSKLYTQPGIPYQKKAWAFYALFDVWPATTEAVEFDVEIDSENGSIPLPNATITAPGPGLTWARSGGAQGAGYAIGFSMLTTAADFSLHEMVLAEQAYALRT